MRARRLGGCIAGRERQPLAQLTAAELPWLCPAWALANEGSICFPETATNKALAKGTPGNNGTNHRKAAPGVITRECHTLRRLSGTITNGFEFRGHRTRPAPLELCAHRNRAALPGAFRAALGLTAGLLKPVPGACSLDK